MGLDDRVNPVALVWRTQGQLSQAISDLEQAWDILADSRPFSCPTFSDLKALITRPGQDFIVMTAWRDAQVIAQGCFVFEEIFRDYWLAEKRILRLKVKTMKLFGPGILGPADAQVMTDMLSAALKMSSALLVAEEIPVGSENYRAIERLGGRHPVRLSSTRGARWTIPLPETLDLYFAQLRASTRKAVMRDLKIFERLSPAYTVYRSVADVAVFLDRAARVSARTYQADMGWGLKATEEQLAEWVRLAQEGRFRGYIATVGDMDCAFSWGDISHGVFYFRRTGYDKDFAKKNAGKALLFFILGDLIRTKSCRIFDFGVWDTVYKERYGTRLALCAAATVGRWRQPRSLLVIAADITVDGIKAWLTKAFGKSALLKLRKTFRKWSFANSAERSP